MRKQPWSLALSGVFLVCAAASLSAQDPTQLYNKNCKNCHGPVGGEPTAVMKARMNPPKLFDVDFLAKTDDARFMKAMMKGGEKMKPLEEKMTKQEMEAVMKFIKDYVKNGGKS